MKTLIKIYSNPLKIINSEIFKKIGKKLKILKKGVPVIFQRID